MRTEYRLYFFYSVTVLMGAGCGQPRMIPPGHAASATEDKSGRAGSAAERGEPPGGPGGAEAAAGGGMAEMQVVRIGGGPGGSAVVLLQEKGGQRRIVPMVIGEAEANAISLRLSRQKTVRPLTHDLVDSVLREYKVRIVKLEIDDLQQGIFLGRLCLEDANGRRSRIDTRPSDGIALALGANAPIFMSLEVVQSTGRTPLQWQDDLSSSDEESEPEQPADKL